MSHIISNINSINKKIAEVAANCGRSAADIKLVAVSKRHPISAIHRAAAGGQKLFGENYLQEAEEKFTDLPVGCNIHFIGNLQSKKAKTAAEICSMIETVDRIKIARLLNNHLTTLNKTLDILIQVNIGGDPNKSGTTPENAESLIIEIKKFKNLQVRGLMTMPPITSNPEDARPFFKRLRELSLQLAKKELFTNQEKIELSMGMSHDFHIAIEEGATLIRVGTAIFGERPLLKK